MDAEDAARLALATWLGNHALAAFGVSLFALLGAATLLWRALAPRPPAGADADTGPAPFVPLLLRAAAGFALIVGAGALFAELAEGVQARRALGAFDDAFTAALRDSVPAPALQAFAAVTHGGDTATLSLLGVLVGALLLLRRRWGLALAWATAVGGNALLNVTLKGVFQRVRPLHDDGPVLAAGFSFPSGHASGSVAAYGMLAYVAVRVLPPRWHLPAALLALAFAFSVGCSRVFLRVHHLSDVLAGFASGGAWLAVCIASAEATRWVRRRRSAVRDPGR